MDHSLSIACGGGVRRVFLGEGGSGFGIWDLVFRGNGRGISRRQESINGGGGRGSGVEGGARRILDLVFSGNGREGYQLSPRDSNGGIIEN